MRIDFPNITGTIDVYLDVMRTICGDTKGKSFIDLGCAFAPNTPKLGFTHRTYIDIIDRKLDHEKEQAFFSQADILDIPLDKGIWHDVAIATDVIEHLTKEDGYKLINIMCNISQMQILFTPTTEIFKMVDDDNHDPEAHRSLWSPDDLEDFNAIVFPDYHKIWNGGAAFYFRTPSLKYDFDRVMAELKTKAWYKS